MLQENARVELDEAQSTYLLRVLRMQESDPVLLFNGRDGEWSGNIVSVRSKRAEIGLGACRRPPRRADGGDAYLLFAPVRKDQTDLIVEKATELGMSAIWPVLTARTQNRGVRADRLRRIAIEASEQSERLDIPEIREPSDLDVALGRLPSDCLVLFCDEMRGADAAPLIGARVHGLHGRMAAILIGPEGGFTAEEREFLRARPMSVPVSLGPRILRAETAAIAAMAIWQAICRDVPAGPVQGREP